MDSEGAWTFKTTSKWIGLTCEMPLLSASVFSGFWVIVVCRGRRSLCFTFEHRTQRIKRVREQEPNKEQTADN